MSRTFRRICVYCGSSGGVDEAYFEAARQVGAELANRGITVVYGGGRVGLMGAVADAALEAGGEVIGVITSKLVTLEVGHEALSELFVVDSMHARKMMMAQLADAFIALPGGFGTLEELFEATTWAQLNYHKKPVGLLDVRGYYGALVAFMEHAVAEGFIREVHAGLVTVGHAIGPLLEQLAEAEVPGLTRWIDKP